MNDALTREHFKFHYTCHNDNKDLFYSNQKIMLYTFHLEAFSRPLLAFSFHSFAALSLPLAGTLSFL